MKLGFFSGFGKPLSVGVGALQGSSAYSIAGVVYDADGSTAVAGATVTLGALTATSAANGTYTILGVAAGASGSMTCTKTGYSWTAKTIAAMSGSLAAQNYSNAWWAGGGSAADCVAAYKAIGAASLTGSYVNLANPGTYDLTTAAAPTFNGSTGWTFNGTTQYLETGYVPANAVTRSGIARMSGAATDAVNRWVFGARNGSVYYGILNTTTGSKAAFLNGTGAQINHTTNVATGVLAVAALNGYIDDIDVGNIGAGTYDEGSVSVRIGMLNNFAATFYSGNIQAVALYSVTLTTTQLTLIKAGMDALNP